MTPQVNLPAGQASASLYDVADLLLTFTLKTDATLDCVKFWQGQVDQLLAQKWHRDERMTEIVMQQADQISFLSLAVAIGPQTHPWIDVLLGAAHDVAFRIATEMKFALPMPRPAVLSPEIAPVIQTPAHSSFPSGHATEAFCAATILGALFPDRADNLRRMAARIAVNRGYAGVHFPVDHHAGAVLGNTLGRIILKAVFGIEILVPPLAPFAAFIAGKTGNPEPASKFGRTVEHYALSGSVVSLVPVTAAIAAAADPGRAPILSQICDAVLRCAKSV